jgi:GTP-binding protein
VPNFPATKIRNVAIIAHVDHGKTTLVDAFLKQSNLFRSNQEEMQQEQIMDSGELERERGITITAKNASVNYKDYKINIIDTPGHADFGGEVERTLNMADGCLLVVDAQEGPMPQTRFVLKKALELKLKPIVVINKIDKQYANAQKALSRVQDLFLSLAQDEDQLDFPVFYAIGRTGKVFASMPTDMDVPANITPLLDAIIEHIPAPMGEENAPLQMQICSLEYNNHIGTLLVGKIRRGSLKVGDSVVVLHNDQPNSAKDSGKVKGVFTRVGLSYQSMDKVGAGDIVAIAGIESKAIGGTLCSYEKLEALPTIKISNPSVEIKFEANTSPFLGREGKFVTAKQIQQRLEREADTNISLRITKGDGGAYLVAGRGELQLSILIETMRREGYEFQIRKPQVVFIEEDGVKKEPVEELVIDVAEDYQGAVSTALSLRRAELINMESENGNVRFTYKILTRNLLGLRNQLILATKGNVVLNNFLINYVPVTEQPDIYRKGVLISSETGTTAAYALNSIQERGDLFVGGSVDVYEGMIIGINKFDNDMEVNPCKERAKSGVRRNAAEITQVALKPLIALTLEFALVFLASDEILEITPQNLRLRKQFLKHHEREWSKRENLTDYAKQQLGITS